MATKISKKIVKLSAENYERVMARFGYKKGRKPLEAPATYEDGKTPFGVLRFWR